MPPPAIGSRRRRPGSSTSAGRARRCTTGRWRSRQGGTFVLRIEDTDEVRNHPEWTQGIIDALAWIGIAADDPTFEGPYFQSAYAAAHVAAAERLYEQGLAYYCDLTPEQIEERARARRQARLRRLLARPRPRARPRPGAALPRARRRDGRRRRHPRRGRRSSTSTSRTSCCCAATARRCSCSPTSSTTSRWASPTSCAARSTCRTRRSSSCCGRRSGNEPPVWAHVPVLVNEAAQEAVEASRQGRPRVVPRRGLPGRRRWSTT